MAPSSFVLIFHLSNNFLTNTPPFRTTNPPLTIAPPTTSPPPHSIPLNENINRLDQWKYKFDLRLNDEAPLLFYPANEKFLDNDVYDTRAAIDLEKRDASSRIYLVTKSLSLEREIAPVDRPLISGFRGETRWKNSPSDLLADSEIEKNRAVEIGLDSAPLNSSPFLPSLGDK